MIYLSPEIASSLGEDTFWTWAAREFPASFDLASAGPDDPVLQYGVLGARPGRSVALLWELYAEMDRAGVGTDRAKIDRMRSAFEGCARSTVSSPSQLEFYPGAAVLPIGVDTDLFAPARRDHIGRVGFWCGTDHPMKGRDRLERYASEHPEIRWNIVHKTDGLPQTRIAELMNGSDFILATGRLRPWFMIEWEAMACDLPVIDVSGLERDFTPSAHPRDDVMARGWSRPDTLRLWKSYLGVLQ